MPLHPKNQLKTEGCSGKTDWAALCFFHKFSPHRLGCRRCIHNIEALPVNAIVIELKKRKVKLGLSNRELATMSGVPYGTVCRLL